MDRIPSPQSCHTEEEKVSAVKLLKSFNTQIKPTTLEPQRDYKSTSENMNVSIGTDFAFTRVSETRVRQTENKSSSFLVALSAQGDYWNRGKRSCFPKDNTRSWHQWMMGGVLLEKISWNNIFEIYDTFLMRDFKHCCSSGFRTLLCINVVSLECQKPKFSHCEFP